MHFATEFWLTRLCFQHALGSIYLIAFLIAANQFIPLLGMRGLQPVRLFVRHVAFRRAPSLFYINCSDFFIAVMIWCGVGLSCFALTGFSESFGLGVSMLTTISTALKRKGLTSQVGSTCGPQGEAMRFICRSELHCRRQVPLRRPQLQQSNSQSNYAGEIRSCRRSSVSTIGRSRPGG